MATNRRRSRLDGKCSRCHERDARENQSYCTACTAEMFREYRSDPQIAARHRLRGKAYNAMRRGKINRRPCRVCGSKKSEMHHPDYRRPFHVEWYCRAHHVALHAGATP